MNARWKNRYGRVVVAMLTGPLLIGIAIFWKGRTGSVVQEAGATEIGSTQTGSTETGSTETGAAASVSSGIEATPPKGQHYVGKNTCAACHFDKYRTWKHEKHALAFEILPIKYRQDPKCLICHTTGYGESTGYKDVTTPQLAGITCESCHGPGSEHVKLAQELFLGAEAEVSLETEQKIRNSIELFLEKQTGESEEARKQAMDSIYRIRPGNACVQCHTTKAHQAHLYYDKE
ncbi:cytochrome c family protein [Pirellulales bacterium]|nr:cytochrome c family protein [Pirellulales bacterium]